MISAETTGYVWTEGCQNIHRENKVLEWAFCFLVPSLNTFKPFGTWRHCHCVRQLSNCAWHLLEHSLVLKKGWSFLESWVTFLLILWKLAHAPPLTQQNRMSLYDWLPPTLSQISCKSQTLLKKARDIYFAIMQWFLPLLFKMIDVDVIILSLRYW